MLKKGDQSIDWQADSYYVGVGLIVGSIVSLIVGPIVGPIEGQSKALFNVLWLKNR